jgi:apolipoprotein D and lipocalin family protein
MVASLFALLSACQSVSHPPLALASKVDLSRFMGDWYVIANIPTYFERGAHNAVESYRLAPDGSIDVVFSYRSGSFEGEPKQMKMRAHVQDGSGNAVWGMEFIWPFKADYRVAYLAADYSLTVIGREKRDYVWVMARTPQIAESERLRLMAWLAAQGYDVSQVRQVPQRWDASVPKSRTAP